MREVSLECSEFAELSTEILGAGGSFCFKAHGFSMYPLIRHGDILTIQPVEVNALKVGDVAFYRSVENRLVAHRIVERYVQHDQVILKIRGDATQGPDEKVLLDQVLGKVISVQRGRNVKRLDQGFWNLLTHLWVNVHPLVHLFFKFSVMVKKVASWLLRWLQSMKLYRVLARKLIEEKIYYRIATAEDAFDLSRFYGYERLPDLRDPVGTFAKELESIDSSGYILIASIRGRIAGAVNLIRFPENEMLYPEWWIFGMLVRTRYRGAGIGEGLVRMAMEKVAGEQAKRINLLVFEKNRAAANLYRKMGFRRISIPELDGQLEEEVRRGNNQRIIMSRPLAECNL